MVSQRPLFLLSLWASMASAQQIQLKGQYTFSLTGQEANSSGAAALVGIDGSFYADGQGHITSGVLDKNSASGLVQAQNLTGSYQFTLGGKGSVTLSSAAGSAGFTLYSPFPGSSLKQTFSIVAGTGTLQSASGQLALSSSLPPYSNGSGIVSASLTTQAAPGQLQDFGAAILTFSPPAAGQVAAQGIATVYDSAPQPFTTTAGTYTTPDPVTGRFTMTLPGLGGSSGDARNYVVYPASGYSRFFFLSLDPVPAHPLVAGAPAD